MKEWNFDAVIIGGGVTGCAIARELSRYEMHAALIEREDVYYVQEAGADMSWLGRYYEEMGVKISVERAEAVGDAFEIYRLRRA